MKNLLKNTSALSLIFALISTFAAYSYAGYLDFSSRWQAPAQEQGNHMSKRKAGNIVSSCSSVQAYANKAGRTSGAMVVAGPHTTADDGKLHLTVRLYNQGVHEKSCHVYVKNGDFSSCSCQWL